MENTDKNRKKRWLLLVLLLLLLLLLLLGVLFCRKKPQTDPAPRRNPRYRRPPAAARCR